MTNEKESPHQVTDDHSLIGALAIGASVLAGLALCFLAFSFYAMESLPVAQSKMNRIQPGLTLAEVKSILGNPDRVYLRDDTTVHQWTYCPAFHWQMFQVHFDDNGLVTEAVLDR